ncbi:hypothetical protein MFU01_67340 [Myxococcus fulvus]|nr:ATP-binding protein [Myxococcus fulvus]GEN11697.1 hypothetical protein MFU01_67340 [Myxococcus fulvus]
MVLRIVKREDVPSLSSPETDVLDWKKEVDPSRRQELAKDIAAMANTSGGSIVVGVKEGGASVRAALCPLSRDQALRLATAYEQVARDCISPPVKVDVATIELEFDGSGKWILAVNVSATEAIFCAVRKMNEVPGQGGEQGWIIPKRVASQTKFLTPADAQLGTVEKLRSATHRTLELIEAWQDDVEAKSRIRRFEEFMAHESHYDVRFPELGAGAGRLGLEYTIRPVRDAQGVPLQTSGEMRGRWLVYVVGPAQEHVRSDVDLARYDDSPIRDGEYYYCEFYNGSWHMSDGGMVKSYSFYMSGRVGAAEWLERANEFAERSLSVGGAVFEEVCRLLLDLEGNPVRSGGGYSFLVVKDASNGLFLRVGDSPPKAIYLMNSAGSLAEEQWDLEIEKFRGYGGSVVQRRIKKAIHEDLQRRGVSVPKRRWHQTSRALRPR